MLGVLQIREVRNPDDFYLYNLINCKLEKRWIDSQSFRCSLLKKSLADILHSVVLGHENDFLGYEISKHRPRIDKEQRITRR